MTLFFDIGNSRIKWQLSGSFSDVPGAFSYQLAELEAQLDDQLKDLRKPNDDVVFVSVASKEVLGVCKRWIEANWGVGVKQLSSEGEWHGFRNGYSDPERLGADRWYALIGAIGRYATPFVICDVGTAVTIDIVDQHNQHLGGYIIPGLELMTKSLTSGTAIVLNEQPSNDILSIPTDTSTAIASGCRQAIIASIDATMERVGKSSRCILTGGGAEQLALLLKSPVTVDNNLIFHGISNFINENKNT